MAEGVVGRNMTFPIFNSDGTPFNDLVLHKATYDTVVMSLGDKITGDVYYKDNTLAVTMGEYIEFKQNPNDASEQATKFILVNPPTVVKEGMVSDNSELRGMTKYSFTFYHPMCLLANFPFSDVAVTNDQKRYLSENKSFSWIGTMEDYVAKLNKNLEGTQWIVVINIGSVAQEDRTKLSDVMTFDNQSIADALKTGYETWKVPYVVDVVRRGEVSYSSGKRFKVMFGLPTTEIRRNGIPFVFKYGQGVGLKNNSRTPRNNKIVTRIAGYGSEDNIPYGYPQIIWTGNQSWDYTVNNDSAASNSYPIYDGIVGGQKVRLIKHPFTRTHLMPSVYIESLNRKVNPNATGYDPTEELVDYYDADNTYENPINPSSPSYEIHEFGDIKPELGDRQLVSVATYDTNSNKALSMSDFIELVDKYYSESENDDEKTALVNLKESIQENESDSGSQNIPGQTAYNYWWDFYTDGAFIFVTYSSTRLNFTSTVLTGEVIIPSWDDTMDDDGNYVQSYFKVTLPALGFDLYACAAITQEMKINMRSGACMGCSFDVAVDWDAYKANFYDEQGNFDPAIGTGHRRDANLFPNSTSQQITLIVKKDIDTFGTLMPNIYQQPAANDKFVIIGISLPTSYITSAQTRLDDDMKQYMHDNNVYYYDYPLKFDEYFLAQNTNILTQMKPNIVVYFEYAGVQLSLYIKQMTVKYGDSPLPQYNITLTDDVEIVLNQIGQVTSEVSNLRVLMGQNGFGGNASLEEADKRYLRKDADDTAAGLIRMIRGMQVGERFVTGLLGEGGIFRKDADGKTYLECDRMYVRMKAYFDTVEVRRFIHSGGNRIASAAGMKCSRVEYIKSNGEVTDDASLASKFRCYFRAGDNGTEITNDFVVNDLAYCKETNIAGEQQGAVQRYYWRKVIDVSSAVNENGEHYIDLSKTDCATGSDIPIAQDDIIQLGNTTDNSRQGAIIEYVSGEDAPSYQIYQDINSYSLEEKNYVRLGYDSESGSAQAYIGNPDGSTYLWYHLVTEGNVTFPRLDIKANVEFSSPDPTYGTETLDDFIAAITQNVENIQDQVDGNIESWFYDYMPVAEDASGAPLNRVPLVTRTVGGQTVPVYPYYDWYTADGGGTASEVTTERTKHLGDTFYDNSSGYAFRFTQNGMTDAFEWAMIEDSAVIKALADAARAQDTADHKRRVFVAQPTVPYDVGDLWVNAVWPNTGASIGSTFNNDVLRCVTSQGDSGSFNIAHWVLASKYTDDTVVNDFINNTYAPFVQQIHSQVDSKAETWYQDSNPAITAPPNGWYGEEDGDTRHIGDIWFNTSDSGGKKTYIWKDFGTSANPRYAWAEQAVPKVVFDTIDGKCAIYTAWGDWIDQETQENLLQEKDLLIPASDISVEINTVTYTYKTNKVYRCTNVSIPVFTEIRYTDDSTITRFVDILTNGSYTGGAVNFDAAASAQYAIKHALNEGVTTIDGGLILSNIIALRDSTAAIMSGLNGVYNGALLGGGIAAWYGGAMVDIEALTGTAKTTYDNLTDQQKAASKNYAKSLDRFDGSGYRASGNITWDASGNVTLQGYSINATTLQKGGVAVATTGDLAGYVTLDTLQTITGAKVFTNKIYLYKPNSDDTGAVYFMYEQGKSSVKLVGNFYATGAVSALGSNSGGGGGSSVTLYNPLLSINNINANPTSANSLLVWNGTSWGYKTTSEIGTNMSAVWSALAAATNEDINITHIISALVGCLTQGTDISITRGTGANVNKITIASTYSYSLPTADTTTKGGIKVGTTLAISNEVLNLAAITLGTPASGDTTYTKFVVDGYGRIIKATTLAAGDIPDIYALKTNTVTGVAVGTAEGHTNDLAITKNGTTTYITVPFASTAATATNATTATKLTSSTYSIFGNNYIASGVPQTISNAAMSGVTNIDGLIYFDTTNNRVGIYKSSGISYTLDINGTLNVIGTSTTQVLQPSADDTYNIGTTTAYYKYLYIKRIYLSSGIYLEVDGNSVKLNGNFYATGAVSALGTSGNTSGGVGDVTWTLLASSSDTRQIAKSHLNVLNGYVTNTASENIGGNKTFTGSTTFNGTVTLNSNVVAYGSGGITSSSGFVHSGISGATTNAQRNEYVLLGGGGTKLLSEIGGKDTDCQHNARGTDGSLGWVLIARITVSNAYKNQSLRFVVVQRDRKGALLSLVFKNVDAAANTDVKSFTYDGEITSAVMRNSSNGVWDMYIQKSEAYDAIGISIHDKGSYMSGVTITWMDAHASSVPSSATTRANVTASSSFSIPTASSTTIGGIMVNGNGLKVESSVLKVDASTLPDLSGTYATNSSLNNYLPLDGSKAMTGSLHTKHLFEVFNGTSSSKQSAYIRFTRNGANGNDYAALGWNGNNVRLCALGGASEITSEADLLLVGNNGQLKLQAANGTSPITTSSTTLVSNLNADLLDGKHASEFALSSALSGYVTLTTDQDISGAKKFAGGITPIASGAVKTASGGGKLWIKRAARKEGTTLNDETPNNGLVFEFGGGSSWIGQLFMADNGGDGIYWGGWYNGERSEWKKIAFSSELDNYVTLATGQSITGTKKFMGTYGGLVIYGGYASNEGFRLETVNSSGTWASKGITVLQSGNVGIGTDSPSQKLHVNGSGIISGGAKFNDICIECTSDGTFNAGLNREINAYSVPLHLQYSSSGNTTICYGGGNVGIGTTSPSEKLSVNGNASFTSLNFYDYAGTSRTVLTKETTTYSVGREEKLIIGSGYIVRETDSSSNVTVLGRTYICGANIHFMVNDATSSSSSASVQAMRMYANGKTFVGTDAEHTSLQNINASNGHPCGLNAYKALIGKLYLYKPNANNDTNAVWFEIENGVVKLNGSFYATGAVSALGANGSGGGGSSITLGVVLNHINTHNPSSFAPSVASVLYYESGIWVAKAVTNLAASVTTDCVKITGTQTVSGDKTFSGDTSFTGKVNVVNNITPTVTNQYGLGTSDKRFANVYATNGNFSGTLTAGTLSFTNLSLSGTLSVGSTATAVSFIASGYNQTYVLLSGSIKALSEFVQTSGNQSVAGNKTFSGSTTFSGSATFSNSVGIGSSTSNKNLTVMGMVGINTSAGAYQLSVNGTSYFGNDLTVRSITFSQGSWSGSQDSDVQKLSTNNKSFAVNVGTGSAFVSKNWSTGSDMRLKDIVAYIDNLTVEGVASAPVFKFTWKDSEAKEIAIGTSAQYWRNVLPNAVTGNDNSFLALDYNAVTIASVVATARKVVDHEHRIQQLEWENERLRKELETLKAA